MKTAALSFILSAIALLLVAFSADATADNSKALELICFTENLVITEGGSTVLNAWASSTEGRKINLPVRWDVGAGHIATNGPRTKWDLSAVAVEPPSEVRTITATARVSGSVGSTGSCSVEVLISRQVVADESTAESGGVRDLKQNLISGRHYLLPNGAEEDGYGLYSYLLFSAPAKARNVEEKRRYLKTIEAYLLAVQSVDEYLNLEIPKEDLNVMYIPVKAVPKRDKSTAQWAKNVLAVYDYSRAQILLSRVHQDPISGPYLVSTLAPLSHGVFVSHLSEDLTGVSPSLAWEWMRFFTYLAAKQRSWSEESLYRFRLNLRNLIAVGATVTPPTVEALSGVIQYVKGQTPPVH